MPRNGSGQFNLANGPFVPSTVISSTTMNSNFSDIGTALTQSIANDGQTTPVANLPMATFRHTNVGNAAARTDYAAAGQVQDSSLQWLTSIAGADTITASIAPGPAAYAAGQTFRFISAATNTTAVTLNINGLGAKSVTKNGANALQAGDIPSGAVIQVTYDGTQFQLSGVFQKGALLGVQRFTANGTYTPTPGTASVIVELVGAGGGSGGTTATGAGTISTSGGGGSGAYARSRLTSGFSGASVTVGTAGAAGTSPAGAGGNGTASSFGALTAGGGIGSAGRGAFAPPYIAVGGGGGTTPVTGNLVNGRGTDGATAFSITTGDSVSGVGGSTIFGAGGTATNATGAGNAGVSYGSGAGGAFTGISAAAQAGAAGAPGVVFVYEYA